MDRYQVSVVVVTYNPDREKLLDTLRSIVMQKNISFQIVIADDGSAEPETSACHTFFQENDFTDYVIVNNETNRGTVYNMVSAVARCSGTYVKSISPGDLLSGENVLAQWVAAANAAGAVVSFCDAVYYVSENGEKKPVQRYANPQLIRCYKKNRPKAARYIYLLLDDLFLGAALICRTDVIAKYLDEIAGKIVYAEDNIYRLMVYDRLPVHYFPQCGILYETDSGISTSGSSFWHDKLMADWDCGTQLLMARCTGLDPIDTLLKKRVALPTGGLKATIGKYLAFPKAFYFRMHSKYFPRKSHPTFPK